MAHDKIFAIHNKNTGGYKMQRKHAVLGIMVALSLGILMASFNGLAQAAPLNQQQWYIHPSGADGCGMGYGDPSIESDPNKVGTFTGINLQAAAIMRCNGTYLVKAGAKAYGNWTWVHLNGPDANSKGWAVLVGRDWAWGPYVPPTTVPQPTRTPTPQATAVPVWQAAGVLKFGSISVEVWPLSGYRDELKRGNNIAWDLGMLYTNAPSLIIGLHNKDNNKNKLAGTALAKQAVGNTMTWTPTNGAEMQLTIKAIVTINNNSKEWERMLVFSKLYKLTSLSCSGEYKNGDWTQRVVVFAN